MCSADGLYLFVTNLIDGVDQYRFPSLEKVQSFPHAIETNHPLQVSTVNQGALIVCGGDNGFARVYDRRTGQLVQRLQHDKRETTLALNNSKLMIFILAQKKVATIAVCPVQIAASLDGATD